MRILILGRGKTGSIVAEVATERGHSVRTMTESDNVNGSALTPPFLVQFDVVIDFTTPQAAVENMRACLAAGAKMVVGTTGWHEHLPEIRSLVERKGGALLYGTNFSAGVQMFFRMAQELARAVNGNADYKLEISETHHTTKLDAPSGTAKTLQNLLAEDGTKVEIQSHRTGDAVGTHQLIAAGPNDRIVLEHQSLSRKAFAEGAVRGAEWLVGRDGLYDFQDVFAQM
jgi:4-hydroxy-tetrahydrodipicolinate reductase